MHPESILQNLCPCHYFYTKLGIIKRFGWIIHFRMIYRPHQAKKGLRTCAKMHRFRSSCTSTKYHPGLCAQFIHSRTSWFCLDSEGPYLTLQMHRLIWTAVHTCTKTHFHMAWPIMFCLKSGPCYANIFRVMSQVTKSRNWNERVPPDLLGLYTLDDAVKILPELWPLISVPVHSFYSS